MQFTKQSENFIFMLEWIQCRLHTLFFKVPLIYYFVNLQAVKVWKGIRYHVVYFFFQQYHTHNLIPWAAQYVSALIVTLKVKKQD